MNNIELIKTQRQDFHITDYKINKDKTIWKQIQLYDQDEARRMGWNKKEHK